MKTAMSSIIRPNKHIALLHCIHMPHSIEAKYVQREVYSPNY